MAAGAQNTIDFTQALDRIRKHGQHLGQEYDIETVILERQGMSIALHWHEVRRQPVYLAHVFDTIVMIECDYPLCPLSYLERVLEPAWTNLQNILTACQIQKTERVFDMRAFKQVVLPVPPFRQSLNRRTRIEPHIPTGAMSKCHYFSTINEPMARASSPDVTNVRNASSGEQTMGSPFRLNDVLRTIGTPVLRLKLEIRR